jgi:hypothetical protein
MQQPIVLTKHDRFVKKTGLSDIEIRGMKDYLNDFISEYVYGDDTDVDISCDMHFGLAFSNDQLNCCDETPLPFAPEDFSELEDVPVSHFFLTENHIIIAVFFVGENEDEVYVRMN